MKMPRSRFRSTAYHMVVASSLPWIRSHGRAGGSASVAILASISCRLVAT
jgi:hypothetical protein